MRSLFPILLLCCVAVGCGVSAEPVAEAQEPIVQQKDIAVPADAPATKLGLIREGKTLQAGDSVEKALSIFPRPEKANSLNELPEGWPKGFRATGWDNEKEGFGMILQGERVVAAMVSEEDVDQPRIDQIVSDYTSAFSGDQTSASSIGPRVGPVVSSPRYWVWEDQSYRCMICVTTNPKGQKLVTAAMGYSVVMDALGLGADAVDRDLAKAAKLLQNAQRG